MHKQWVGKNTRRKYTAVQRRNCPIFDWSSILKAINSASDNYTVVHGIIIIDLDRFLAYWAVLPPTNSHWNTLDLPSTKVE